MLPVTAANAPPPTDGAANASLPPLVARVAALGAAASAPNCGAVTGEEHFLPISITPPTTYDTATSPFGTTDQQPARRTGHAAGRHRSRDAAGCRRHE